VTPEQVKTFLTFLGAKHVTITGAWAHCSCPLAHWTHDSGKDSHPSFAIKCNVPTSFYNCFSCGSGDLFKMLQRLNEFGAKPPKYNIKEALAMVLQEDEDNAGAVVNFDNFGIPFSGDQETIIPFAESWLDSFMWASNSPKAMEYLHDRNVTKDTANYWELRWDSKREAVGFPVRDFGGACVGLRGRHIAPKIDPTTGEEQPRYHIYKGNAGHYNRLPWFGEHRVEFTRPVLIVESVFDLISTWRVYRNVVAPMTSGMSVAKVERMKEAVEIYTLLDLGKGGDVARDKISKVLNRDGRFIKHLYPSEKDPGEMSIKQLQDVLSDDLQLENDCLSI
jgi:DNA primase